MQEYLIVGKVYIESEDERKTMQNFVEKLNLNDHSINFELEKAEDKNAVSEKSTVQNLNVWQGDSQCSHDLQPAEDGGLKCTNCSGWFCYYF